jgi:hypothetical protein
MALTRIKQMKRVLLVAAVAAGTLFGGYATSQAEENQVVGANDGAAIPGAIGHLQGKAQPAGAGALLGGVFGDEQMMPFRYDPAKQCWMERVPHSDSWGKFVGYSARRVCN